jgi:hypothetical protein
MTTSALSQLSEKLGDNHSVQKILELTMQQGLTPDDPQLHDLLKEINFIESLQVSQRKEFEAIVTAAISAQSAPPIQKEELEAIVKSALATQSQPSQKEELGLMIKAAFAAQKQPLPLSLPTILAMLIGAIVGITVTGTLAHFYLIPLQIAEQRASDRETLQYLNSKEGIFFRQIVKLNHGYLDTKQCRSDAAKFKVQLNRNGQKVENVCLIEVPRS